MSSSNIVKHLFYVSTLQFEQVSREEASPAHPADSNLTNVIKTGFNEFGNFDPKLLHDSGRAQAEMCGAVSLLIQVKQPNNRRFLLNFLSLYSLFIFILSRGPMMKEIWSWYGV